MTLTNLFRATALATMLAVSSGAVVPTFAAPSVTKPVTIVHECEFSAQAQASSLPLSNRFDFSYGGGVACVDPMLSVALSGSLMEGAQPLGSFTQVDAASNSSALAMSADLSKAFHQACSLAVTVDVYEDFVASVTFNDGSTAIVHIQTLTTPVVCDATP